MSLEFLGWLLIFFLQIALLGCCMYKLLVLTDLQADNLNPFDATKQFNRLLVPELVVLASATALLLAAGMWAAAAMHLGTCAFLLRLHLRKQAHMQAADAFRQLPGLRRNHYVLFAAYCSTFLLVTYRLIEAALKVLLSHAGRAAAKTLFRDAASSLHGF